MIFIGFASSAEPDLSSELNTAAAVDGIMVGARVPNAMPFPAGPLGGTMRCGTMRSAIPVCAWADASSLGMVLDATSGTPAQAAATTRALRRAAEH